MKRFRITSILMALMIVFSFVLTACGGSATLDKIEVTKLPKTEYIVGETLDLTGGELTATYSDGTTTTVSLSNSEVTVQRPNMNTAGEKTVSVTYQSKSATFKVTVSEAKLVVTFDLNYQGAPAATTVEVEKGETVSEPTAPTRNGYAFLGWFVAADSNTKYNFSSPITQNVTIYARWGYSVEFNLNYEGAKNTTQVVAIGEKVARPATNPERDGYLFTDWYTTKECATEFDFNGAITANTVIYAGWLEVGTNAKFYTVTFDLNDGAGTTQTRQVVEGQTVAEPTAPTLTGGTFEGWYTDEALTTPYNFSTPVTADITLYAKWTLTSYAVTFHYNHANNDGIYTVILADISETGTRITPPENPELDGYYFSGWYRETDCSGDQVAVASSRITGPTHYYAKWLKEWEFQAEDTDFGEREAFGYSANGKGPQAFIMSSNAQAAGAHNGHWVANLHNKGLYVEFIIESDAEVFDAALVLRISADFYDIVLHKDNFEIVVNGEVIAGDYYVELNDAVAPDAGGIQNKRPFTNHEFLTGLHLVKGKNTIRFNIIEEKRYGEVGTMYATAPMMDSIYVNCNANLSMTPVSGNY